MSWRERLGQAISGGPHKKTVGIIPSSYVRQSKKILPTYAEMIDRYLAESRIKCAIDELRDISVGVGFHTTCAKGFEKAKDAVDDFCEDVNLDNINAMVATEVFITGNALLWEKTPANLTDLVRVPIYSITDISSDSDGNVTGFKQKFKGDMATNITKADMKHLKRIVQNPIDTGLIGRGLLEPYVRQGAGYSYKNSKDAWATAYRPSLAETNEEIEDMMRVALTRYSPKFAFELGGFSEDEASDVSTKINQGSWVDDLLVWYKGDIKDRKFFPHRLSTDPRSRLDPFIEHFVDKELVTTQTPSVKLISSEGFTEASSRTAEAIEMRKVSAFQRFYKRFQERELFVPVIMSALTWTREKAKQAEVRLHWGAETKVQIEIANLTELKKFGIISALEARKNISEMGVILIEGEEENLETISSGGFNNPQEKGVVK